MTKPGNAFRPGDVVLARIQFTDSFEIKQRPALILYEAYGNVVVAGITSNPSMKGIPLTKEEGAAKDSVIKTNYVFTITPAMIAKKLFSLGREKKREVYRDLMKRLSGLED